MPANLSPTNSLVWVLCQVVIADKGNGKENVPHENLMLAGDPLEDSGGSVYRIKPNPFVSNTPIYVGPKGPTSTKNTKNIINHLQGMILDKTGRVQHDDPVIEAVIGQQLGDLHVDGDDRDLKTGWQGPTVRARGHSMDDEPECISDMSNSNISASKYQSRRQGAGVMKSSSKSGSKAENATVAMAKSFDICPPGNPHEDGKKAIVLAPSLLTQKLAERAETSAYASIWSDTLLMPGMVLLKGWLSMDDQVLALFSFQSSG